MDFHHAPFCIMGAEKWHKVQIKGHHHLHLFSSLSYFIPNPMQ